MTVADILKLTDPKNQNLPGLNADSSTKNYDVLFVPVFEETVRDLVRNYPALARLSLTGEKKEVHHVAIDGQIWRIKGMGKKKEMNVRKVRRLFGAQYLAMETLKVKKIGMLCEENEWFYFAAIGIHVAALNPNIFKSSAKKEVVPQVSLINKNFKTTKAEKEIRRGEITAEGKNLMRVLGITPPNSLTVETYSKVIMALAKKWGVKCTDIPKKSLVKYELLNAVSRGSKYDSKLMMLTIPVAGSKKATVVVGKGLCYDSGGIQGKGDHMKTMKEDMAGSASLLGTIHNIVKNKLKLKETTHFFLPLAENMMGSGAQRADDVWTAGDGQTVEIVHTDAEGRLVMGDAICYAKNNLKNIDKVFTIATLTGSCAVSLGEVYTGALCNDDQLTQEVIDAGKKSGDFVYPGPWDLDYDDNNSPIADVANLGEKARHAGWLQAGFYLARFVPKDKKTGEHTAKFCHFDIAGTIDMDGSGASHRRKGFSSGIGVGYLSLLLTK